MENMGKERALLERRFFTEFDNLSNLQLPGNCVVNLYFIF